jgi:hypothetical protein
MVLKLTSEICVFLCESGSHFCIHRHCAHFAAYGGSIEIMTLLEESGIVFSECQDVSLVLPG